MPISNVGPFLGSQVTAMGRDIAYVPSWIEAKWCTTFPSMCSAETYAASRALLDPSTYAAMPRPPIPGYPSEGQTSDALLAEQMREWQTRNQVAMQETQANLDRYRSDYERENDDTAGLSWLLWLAGGLAVAGLVIGGRR
jgi:hypothetical protein